MVVPTTPVPDMDACPPDGATPAAWYAYVYTVIVDPTFAVVPAAGDWDDTNPTEERLDVKFPGPPLDIV